MRTIITCILLTSFFSVSAQNIVLNSAFGDNGFTYADNTTEIKKIVQAPDGSIISAGIKSFSSGDDLVLTKHDAFGTQDLTFGSNGVSLISVDAYDDVYALQLQTDGKIILAGSTYTGSDTGGFAIIHAFAIRCLPNGMIDSSFATNGIFRVTSYTQSEFNAALLQNDQSLRLISYSDGISYITKLTSAGVLDTSFGTNGSQAISDLSTFFFFNRGAIALSDGSILSYGVDNTGSSSSRIGCVKTDASGNRIISFGQNGIASFDLDTDDNTFEMLTKGQELPDGKILLAGDAADKVIIRIHPDGTLDSTFATNGILNHSLPSNDMVAQPTGKILIGGHQQIGQTNWSLLVSRFNSDGTTDNSFNGTGDFEFDFSTKVETLKCMVLTAPDRLLIGGRTNFVNNFTHFLLAEIDMSNTLHVQENKADLISLYPNPVSDELTISVADESITAIQLTDAAGRLISTHPVEKNTHLSLKHLPAGMYQVILVTNSEERISKKLIKN